MGFVWAVFDGELEVVQPVDEDLDDGSIGIIVYFVGRRVDEQGLWRMLV